MAWTIFIKTMQGNILKIKVDIFYFEGGMVKFTDPKDDKEKFFPVSQCEIVDDTDNSIVSLKGGSIK